MRKLRKQNCKLIERSHEFLWFGHGFFYYHDSRKNGEIHRLEVNCYKQSVYDELHSYPERIVRDTVRACREDGRPAGSVDIGLARTFIWYGDGFYYSRWKKKKGQRYRKHFYCHETIWDALVHTSDPWLRCELQLRLGTVNYRQRPEHMAAHEVAFENYHPEYMAARKKAIDDAWEKAKAEGLG